MVLSSLSPLFVLWAIRGNSLFPNAYFAGACILLATLPTAFLLLRIHVARKNKELRELFVGGTEDHRSHVLVYLFATLLPFYREDLATLRDLAAMLVALAFIVFLFWQLNLHYINVLFALRRYQVFTVWPPVDGNRYTDHDKLVLITRRKALTPGERLRAYRISDTVYLEREA